MVVDSCVTSDTGGGGGGLQSIVNNLLPTACSLTAKSGVKLAICGVEGAPIANSQGCSTSR